MANDELNDFSVNPIGFLDFGLLDFIETLIIAGVLVAIYRWIRGTYAIRAGVGILFLLLINFIIRLFGFTTIDFILSAILDVGILAVFIIFQPEIRGLLYQIGQNPSLRLFGGKTSTEQVIDEVVEAVKVMAKDYVGALIVFAPPSSLSDIIEKGVGLDASIKSELLISIFKKETPLHDGAVVIRNNRIAAAKCLLPTAQNPNLSTALGTRHRAAIGVSETNNVFVIVISEETGRISIAQNGNLTSGLTIQRLRKVIAESFSLTKFKDDVAFSGTQTEMNLK